MPAAADIWAVTKNRGDHNARHYVLPCLRFFEINSSEKRRRKSGKWFVLQISVAKEQEFVIVDVGKHLRT